MKRVEVLSNIKHMNDMCEAIFDTKGRDYTQDNSDALHNFKAGAEFLDITPLQCFGVYFKKHIDAIFTYIKNNGQSESEPIQERIKDAILYLQLLNCMVIENHGVQLPIEATEEDFPYYVVLPVTEEYCSVLSKEESKLYADSEILFHGTKDNCEQFKHAYNFGIENKDKPSENNLTIE